MNTESVTLQVELKSALNSSDDLRYALDKQRDLLVTSIYYMLRDEFIDRMDGVFGKDWLLNVKVCDDENLALSQAPKKVYKAERHSNKPGDISVVVTDQSGNTTSLHHVTPYAQTPDGLEWAFGGSGPADLALSILADYFDERPSKAELYEGRCKCWDPHQAFKRKFIAGADKQGFAIATDQIKEWLEGWKRDEI